MPATLSVRYRDNFLAHIIVRGSQSARTWEEAVTRRAMVVQKHIEHLTGMRSTIEQFGPEMDFLECRLRPLHTADYIRVKSAVVNPPPQSAIAGDLRKMLDPRAPNTPKMLQSAVPNMARKAQHYRASCTGATQNFSQMGGLLQCKGYTKSAWKPKLREMARRWDMPYPERWTPLPLGPCSRILCQYLESGTAGPCPWGRGLAQLCVRAGSHRYEPPALT